MSGRLREASVVLGRPGLAGPAGATGPAGPKGDTGAQGPAGSITGMPSKVLSGTLTNATTTPSAITGLDNSVGANETWEVEYWMATGCSGSGGIVFSATAPAGATAQILVKGSGSAQSSELVQIISESTSTAAYNTAVFFNGVVVMRAVFKTGVTAGTIGMRFAAGVSGQTASIYQWASMTARRVA